MKWPFGIVVGVTLIAGGLVLSAIGLALYRAFGTDVNAAIDFALFCASSHGLL